MAEKFFNIFKCLQTKQTKDEKKGMKPEQKFSTPCILPQKSEDNGKADESLTQNLLHEPRDKIQESVLI